MVKYSTSLIAVALTTIVFSSSSAHAQSARWYQVELMVFKHNGGEQAEAWEATPQLAYPDAFRFLIDPQRVEHQQRLHETAQGEIDEYGRLILTLPSPEAYLQSDAVPPTFPEDAMPDGTLADTVAPHLIHEEAQTVALPTPFVTLPSRQLEHRGKAAYMNRSGQYEILVHETWVQPVHGQQKSLPIVLDHSGDSGTWPPLQGWVKLYLSRYLHLETNLWLNTQAPYFDNEWRMPAPPLGPLSVIVEERLPAQILEGSSIELLAPLAPLTEVQLETHTLDSQLPREELAPVYPYRHAVLLQQKRRMRSKEVHYIDHPMLGLVIKLTPLGSDELDAMAHPESALTTSGQ